MNRPSNKGLHYSTDIDGYAFNNYIENLEKYCDELEKRCGELEQSNKSLSNAYDDCLVTLHFWEEEYCKCRKELDKS